MTRRSIKPLGVFAPMFVGLSMCHCQQPPRGQVRIDGSSTVYPITRKIGEEFRARELVQVQVAVAVNGTIGGFQRLCKGETDIANASRPINAEEASLCKSNSIEYVEVPVAYDGVSIVVHNDNTWATEINLAELRQLWSAASSGQTMRWNQVRGDWPDTELHLYGPGRDSGTYEFFTGVVLGELGCRQDYFASEDDDVIADKVAADPNGLAYFGFGYLGKNAKRLRALALDDQDPATGKSAVQPSAAAVADGSYQPLSRPLFLYVAQPALERREVELFINFFLTKGHNYVDDVGYVPLVGSAYGLALERVAKRQYGTMFGGQTHGVVGLTMPRLLELQAQKTLTSCSRVCKIQTARRHPVQHRAQGADRCDANQTSANA